jgi:hypothetical protein
VKNYLHNGNFCTKNYQYSGNVSEGNHQYNGNVSVSSDGSKQTRNERCVVCGKKATKRTCYIYFDDGSERVGAPWCEEHVRQLERFANPIFESPEALERFRAEHPRLYERDVEGREIIFLRREEGAA